MTDGREASIVLVDSRQNPKGAILVTRAQDDAGQAQAIPLLSGLHCVHPAHVVEALCVQERAFGASGLTPPEETGES